MEKFEKLDNEQKELVRHWIDKYAFNDKLGYAKFIEKHLTPEPVLIPLKWYWYGECLLCYTGIKNGLIRAYGFLYDKSWANECNFGNSPEKWKEATPEEVEQRLIEEAKRRGFVEGAKFKNKNGMNQTCTGKFQYYSNINNLHCTAHKRQWNIHGCHSNPIILDNGKWAEIIDEKAEVKAEIDRVTKILNDLRSKL